MAQQQFKNWTACLRLLYSNVRIQRTFRVVEGGRRCLQTSSGTPPVRPVRIDNMAVAESHQVLLVDISVSTIVQQADGQAGLGLPHGPIPSPA